jgi:hypothetical protein
VRRADFRQCGRIQSCGINCHLPVDPSNPVYLLL